MPFLSKGEIQKKKWRETSDAAVVIEFEVILKGQQIVSEHKYIKYG